MIVANSFSIHVVTFSRLGGSCCGLCDANVRLPGYSKGPRICSSRSEDSNHYRTSSSCDALCEGPKR